MIYHRRLEEAQRTKLSAQIQQLLTIPKACRNSSLFLPLIIKVESSNTYWNLSSDNQIYGNYRLDFVTNCFATELNNTNLFASFNVKSSDKNNFIHLHKIFGWESKKSWTISFRVKKIGSQSKAKMLC